MRITKGTFFLHAKMESHKLHFLYNVPYNIKIYYKVHVLEYKFLQLYLLRERSRQLSERSYYFMILFISIEYIYSKNL